MRIDVNENRTFITGDIQDIRTVFHLLADEESKDIYLKRLNYLVSGDFRYIKEIVSAYAPALTPTRDEQFRQMLSNLPAGRKFVLYGAGQDAAKWLNFTVDQKRIIADDKRFVGFCSRTKKKQQDGYLGYPVMGPEELLSRKDLSVIVFSTDAEREIIQTLKEGGYPQEMIYDGPAYYNRVICDPDMYFNPPFIKFGENEIFVDAGCLDLFTSLKLCEYCSPAKVYAFEPDVGNFAMCQKRKDETGFRQAKLFPCGLWSERTTLQFNMSSNATRLGGGSCVSQGGEGNSSISVVTVDETIDAGDKVTMIKMDIEGSELPALEGARQVIQRDRPKLAISIYHKPEDLITIPLFIHELVPEYKLYVRHYSSAEYETVLYAVIP